MPSETRIVHSTNSITKSDLRNSIKKGSVRQSGIYSILCSSCNLQYIGENDDLDRKLQQHKYDIRKHNRNNPIVKHISDMLDTIQKIDTISINFFLFLHLMFTCVFTNPSLYPRVCKYVIVYLLH